MPESAPVTGPLSFATDVKTLGIGILLLAGTGFGAYYLINKAIQDKKKQDDVDKSLQLGDPNNYALRLRMAIHNDHWYEWWVDIPRIVGIFQQIPDKNTYKLTVISYRTQFNRDLSKDLKDNLSQSQMAQLINIYARKK
jgi:hypothetical protein